MCVAAGHQSQFDRCAALCSRTNTPMPTRPVDVDTGELDSLILPSVNTDCMQVFLDEVAARHPLDKIVMVLDGAGWHASHSLKAEGQCVVAGPAVVARMGDHCGAQWIEFDVAVAVHEVVAIADQARLVAAFPQRAAAVVRVVDVADIPPSERLQGARHGIGLLRREQQVDMVGHQYVGVHRAALAQCDLAQGRAIAEVVRLREEAGLAVIAALDDMLRDAGKVDASWARHGGGLRCVLPAG